MGLVQELEGIVARRVDRETAQQIAWEIARHFSGLRVYFGSHGDSAARNRDLVEQFRHGVEVPQLADRFGLSCRTVYRIVQREGS